ncbi:MAG: carotenoid 1,2-hydratase [Thiolinea sp.]
MMTAIVCLSLTACEKAPEADAFVVAEQLGGVSDSGFARAASPREFRFPADHGVHPDYRTEWWYVTGNLNSASGRHFGYQLTLFRVAMTPRAPDSPASWATNQLWMGHIALTDVEGGQHYHAERFARGAGGLAGQTDQPFRVWLEDWTLMGTGAADFPWQVKMEDENFTLDLQLQNTKPVVLQGDQGLSQKSSEPGNASYYYSLTRLATAGEIVLDGERLPVSGASWLDREWSTSALGPDQAGWDWFPCSSRMAVN